MDAVRRNDRIGAQRLLSSLKIITIGMKELAAGAAVPAGRQTFISP
jgi:hypothetical protein